MGNNFDLLSVGDASIDVFMTPTESEAMCKIDTKDCYIAFSYGAKIPVRNLETSVGGNAANNSTGTKRLGIKTAIVITLGDDDIGGQIMNKLKLEEVDLTYAIQQTATASNYSTIISYSGERTIFVYHAPRSYEFPIKIPSVPWVYLTSLGENFRPFYNHMVEYIKKNPTTKLVFNPGSWQMRAPVEQIKDVLSLSFLVYVNREEAEKLTGFKESTGKEKELLNALCSMGPKTAIITDGALGSFAFDGHKYLKTGIMPVEAYERTGAGDAFGSGSLSAIIKGKTLEEALLWGTVNSASVIGYVGPQRGLLKEVEINEWLGRAKSSGVVTQEF
ncbi:MAG: carbohydrate kinase family protein [Patescibacteria group bacterium]